MKETHTRFPRKALWRQVDRIIQLAMDSDPGPLPAELEAKMRYQAIRRHLERHEDMRQIITDALNLRDALSWVR